jgi:hypothetical protein
MIWFIMLTYGALVATAFWIANSENSKASQALIANERAMKHLGALDQTVLSLKAELQKESDKSDEAYKRLVEILLSNDSSGMKLKEKLEWLEMKVSNMPKAQSPSPTQVVLTQDKPLQFTVITREGPPAQLKKSAGANPQTVRNIKKQLKELSQ